MRHYTKKNSDNYSDHEETIVFGGASIVVMEDDKPTQAFTGLYWPDGSPIVIQIPRQRIGFPIGDETDEERLIWDEE